jgi:hypothetical protein
LVLKHQVTQVVKACRDSQEAKENKDSQEVKAKKDLQAALVVLILFKNLRVWR